MARCKFGIADITFVNSEDQVRFNHFFRLTGDIEKALSMFADSDSWIKRDRSDDRGWKPEVEKVKSGRMSSFSVESTKDNLAEELSAYTIEGFTPEQQNQNLRSILWLGVAKEAGQRDIAGQTPREFFDRAFAAIKGSFFEAQKNGHKYLAQEMLKIGNHWAQYVDLGMRSLRGLGYTVSTKGKQFVLTEGDRDFKDELGAEVFDGENSNFEKSKGFGDEASFTRDSRDTASSRLKMILSYIPDVEPILNDKGEPEHRFSYLGWPTFVDLDNIWNRLKGLFTDMNPDYGDYIRKLQQEEHPIYKIIADTLDAASPEVQNEFVAVMTGQHIGMQIGLYRPVWKGGEIQAYSFISANSDRNSLVDTVVASWVQNQFDSPLMAFEDGERIINREFVDRIKQRFIDFYAEAVNHDNGLRGDWFLDKLQITLDELGIVLPSKTIKRLISPDGEKILKSSFEVAVNPKGKGLIRFLFDAFESTKLTEVDEEVAEDLGLFAINNPLIGSKKQGVVRRLAQLAAPDMKNVYVSSHRNIEGEMVHTFQPQNYLSNRFRHWKTSKAFRDMLSATSFGRDSLYTELINENPDLLDTLTLKFFDGLKRQATGPRAGQKRGDLSLGSQIFTSLGLFQGPQRNKLRGHRLVTFMAPTLADSNQTPLVNFVKREVSVSIDNGAVVEINFSTMEDLINIAMAEIRRISNFQSTIKEQMQRAGVFENYQSGAELFYMLPYLNESEMKKRVKDGTITETELRTVWSNGTLVLNPDSIVQDGVIWKLIQKETIAAIAETQKEFARKGIVKDIDGRKVSLMDMGYLNNVVNEKSFDDKFAFATADYFLNYMIFLAEYTRIISGDYAHAFNKDVTGTHETAQKRYRSTVSPINGGNFGKDAHYRAVTIGDRVVSSKEVALYTKRLGRTAFDEIVSTDGQEFITVLEDITVRRAFGLIPEDLYQSIFKKVTNQKGKVYEFNEKELTLLVDSPFKPSKMLAMPTTSFPEYDMVNVTLTKSSSYPLIPQLIEGMQLDKLRIAMEIQGIDRAAHVSANKLGVSSVTDVYDKKGNILDDIQFDDIQSLSRINFGMQQDLPIKNMQVRLGSQLNKMAFIDALDVKGFKFMGDSYSGRDLKAVKEGIMVQLYRQAKIRVLKRLDAVQEDDGTYTFANYERVQDLLITEAEKRGWTEPDIEKLKVRNGQFVQPLSYASNDHSIMSLLLSLVENEVVNQRLFGRGYVQVSSAGWIQSGDKTGAIFTQGYNPREGLHSLREDADGNVLPAQIIVPWYFKDQNGNLLDMRAYLGEDGKINPDLLSDDVRILIGWRTPYQGPSSALPFEIVGFLPPNMALIAIVPDEITTQMGSDFDVDALYTALSQYNVLGTEIIKPIEGAEETLLDTILPVQVPRITRLLPKTKTEIIKEAITDEKLLAETKEESEAGRVDSGRPGMGEQGEDILIPGGVVDQTENRKGPTERQLKQAYLDVMYSMLTHKDAVARIMNPLENEDLVTEKALVQDALGITDKLRVPIYVTNQLEDSEKQIAGGSQIAFFSNMSTFNAVIQDFNLKMVDSKGKDHAIVFYDDDNNAIVLTKFSGTGTTSYDGETRTKQQNITLTQNASLDNARVNLLGPLGLNNVTAPTWALMLMGESKAGKILNVSFVSRFFPQEAIRMYSDKVISARGPLSNEFVDNPEEAALEEVKNELTARYFNSVQDEFKFIDPKEINAVKISPQMLLKALKDGVEDSSERKYIVGQLAIIEKLRQMSTYASRLQDVRNTVMFADKNAAGKNLLQTADQLNKVDELSDEYLIAGVSTILGQFDDKGLFQTPKTELGHVVDNTLKFAYNLYGQLFNFDNDAFRSTVDELGDVLQRDPTVIEKLDLWKSVRSTIYAAKDMGFGDVQTERRRLLLGPDSIAHRTKRAKKTSWGINSKYFDRIEPNIAANEEYPSGIQYLGSKAKGTNELEITLTISGHLMSSNLEEAQLMRDHIAYAYLIGGQTNSKSFLQHIPTGYLSHIGFNTALREYVMERDFDPREHIRQYVQHNPRLARSITKADTKKTGPIADEFVLNINRDSLHLKTKDNYGQSSYPSFMAIESTVGKRRTFILYEQVGVYDDEWTYRRIELRGNENMLEYGPVGTTSVDPGNKIIRSPKGQMTGLRKSLARIADMANQDRFSIGPTIRASEYVAREFWKPGLTNIELFEHSLGAVENEFLSELGKVMVAAKDIIHTRERPFQISFTNKMPTGLLGHYSPDLNKVRINSAITNRLKFEKTLLHENVHAFTDHLVQAYETPNQENLPVWARGSIEALDDLRAQAIQSLNTTEHDRLNELMTLHKGGKLEEGVASFSKRELDILYPLINLHEFIAGIMTSPEFQFKMNGIKFKGDQTMLERFALVMERLFRAMARAFGIDIKPGSILENSMYNVITLIDDVLEDAVFEEVFPEAPLDFSDDTGIETPSKFESDSHIVYTDGQNAALTKMERFFKSDDEFFVLQGRAGTGKTTTLQAILKLIPKSKVVAGATLSHAAKDVLKESFVVGEVMTIAKLMGIRPDSIHTGEFRPDPFLRRQGIPIHNLDILILDETSQIGPNLLKEILKERKSGAKIIFVGDNVQHQPIKDGGNNQSPTFTIAKSENTAVLTETVRQVANNPIIKLANIIADKVDARNESTFSTEGLETRVTNYNKATESGVIFLNDEDQAIDLMVKDLAEGGSNPKWAKAIVFNNERHNSPQSVKNMNVKIRERLWDPNRAKNQFNKGEQIVVYDQYSRTKRESPIVFNGQAFVILDISMPYTMPVALSAFVAGENVEYSGNFEVVNLNMRGSRGNVVEIPVLTTKSLQKFENDRAILKQRRLWKLWFGLAEKFANVQYGYAITSHKAQGSTYKNTYVFEDNLLGNTAGSNNTSKNSGLYVAATRASHKLVMHSRKNPDLPIDRNSFSIESTINSPEIDALLIRIRKQISEAYRKADSFKRVNIEDETRHNFFQGRIETLEHQKYILQEANSIEAMVTIADEQLAFAKSIIERPFASDAELKFALDTAKNWFFDVTSDALTDAQMNASNPTNEAFQLIGGKAEAIYEQLVTVLRKNFKSRIEETTGQTVEGDFSAFPDISGGRTLGTAKAWTLDLSMIDNQVGQWISSQIMDADRATAIKETEITNQLRTLKDKLSDKELQTLVVKDKNGHVTGLIGPYSQFYYETVQRASLSMSNALELAETKSLAEASKIRSNAYRKYYKSRNKVELAIDFRFFHPDFKTHTTQKYTSAAKYKAFLYDQFGKEASDEYIEKSNSLYNEYLNQAAAAKLRFEIEAGVGINLKSDDLETHVTKSMEIWELENSPMQYLKESSPAIRRKTYYNKEGWRHVLRIARKKTVEGDLTKLYDPNFINMNENQKAMHKAIINIFHEMHGYLPQEKTRHINDAFIPKIEANFLEELKLGGIEAAARFMNKRALEAISGAKKELGELTATYADTKTEAIAPIRFLSGRDINNPTDDIIRITEMFAAMALNYKFKTQVEDEVRLAQIVIDAADEIETKGGQAVINSETGKYVTVENGLTKLKASVKYAIKAGIEGKKRIQKEGERNIAIYSLDPKVNKKKKAQAKIIEAQRDALERLLDEGKIDDKIYDEKIDLLKTAYKDLGGRNLVLSGFFNGVLAYSQLKGMGWNATAGMTNIAFGLITNIIHAAGRQDFDDREIIRGIGTMLKSRTSPKAKPSKLVMMMNILFEVDEASYGKATARRNVTMLGSFIKNPYEIQRRSEFIIQGAVMIAAMYNTKVIDDAGNERSLYDAYNDDSSFNTKEFSNVADEWSNKDLDGLTKNEFTKFRNRIIQLNKSLHGNYDPNSPIQIKQWQLGRALMMFRTWLPASIAWRFQAEHFDQQLGRVVKGRYITYKDIWKENTFTAIPRAFMAVLMRQNDVIIDGKPLKEIDVANLRANLRELEIYFAMMVTAILIKLAIAGDDDDEDKGPGTWAGRMALTQLYRVKDDLAFYSTPVGIRQILSNPMPAWGTFSSALKIYNATADGLTDPDVTGGEALGKIMRELPGISQASRLYYQAIEKVDNENKVMGRDILN